MTDLLIHVSRRAMASEFEVRFPAERYPQGTQAALDALDRVESLEGRLSFFRPDSELSRVNREAAQRLVAVSPALFELLQTAAALSAETEGAYDVTSAPLWEAWGFARRAGEIPSDAAIAEARSRVGVEWLELDPEQRTVRFRKPGVQINLGSIGKGYALDVCAEHLASQGVNDFLLHGGQSSVLARGFPMPGDATASPWEIGVGHPRRPQQRLGVVRLRDRALGTSSTQFQSFRHRGRRYGHILDPRTGQPAEGVLAATVVARTAAMADALSTAFFVMGAERSMDYCRAHPEIGAILICPGDGRDDLAVRTAGLDADAFALNREGSENAS